MEGPASRVRINLSFVMHILYMFASRAEVENLKDMVKSLSKSVEDLSTEVKLLREELERA